MEFLNILEAQILSTLQTLYDYYPRRTAVPTLGDGIGADRTHHSRYSDAREYSCGISPYALFVFLAATFIGAYIWCTLLIGAGYILGYEWALISQYLKQYLPYLLTGGVVVCVLYALFRRSMLSQAARQL